MLRADPAVLNSFIKVAELEVVGDEEHSPKHFRSDEIALIEAVITTGSNLINQSARSANLRNRHGLNLLAIARQGQRIGSRLDWVVIRAADVLILQGNSGTMPETMSRLGCLPSMH